MTSPPPPASSATRGTAAGLPEWAVGMADMHTHAAPSLLPRHGDDAQTVAAEAEAGFSTVVLKSHEGSTAERAALVGSGAYGGIVLNSAVGGANPDAVEVAARLGGRIVWMPTVSARTHKAAAGSAELSVHRGFELGPVDVIDDGALMSGWHEVLDVVAKYDLVLASGHLSAAETVVLFTAARQRGIGRLVVNHPLMAFLGWNAESAQRLQALGVHLELGILPDLLGPEDRSSLLLAATYPASLLVFGSDLGHAHYPTPAEVVAPWLRRLETLVGSRAAASIMTTQTKGLVLP